MLHRSIQLSIVSAAAVITLIATDMMLPSLPHIMTFFGVSANEVKMLLSFFMLGQFCTVLPWGIITDHLGKSKAMLLGMIGFFIGSLLSLIDHSIYLLFFARFIQGASSIVVPVAGWALIQDLYPKKEGINALAKVSMLTAIVPLFAPFVGGLLDKNFGWRSSFYCIALGAFLLCLIFSVLPRPSLPEKKPLASLKSRWAVYGLILKNRTFLSYVALFGVFNCGEWCFLTVAPFYYASKGMDSANIGFLLTLTSIGFVMGSFLTPKLLALWGMDKLINNSIFLAFLSSVFMLMGDRLHWFAVPWFSALIFSIYLTGSALLWSCTTSQALACFEGHKGAASAVRCLLMLCFAFLGTFMGRIMPHNTLLASGFLLLATAMAAFMLFNQSSFKKIRLLNEST